ncbi:MAG: hypothetical protein ABIS17_13825 [Casimicrobiaceae bacterium]
MQGDAIGDATLDRLNQYLLDLISAIGDNPAAQKLTDHQPRRPIHLPRTCCAQVPLLSRRGGIARQR